MLRITLMTNEEKITVVVDKRQKISDVIKVVSENGYITVSDKYNLHLVLVDKKCRSEVTFEHAEIRENEIIKISDSVNEENYAS